MIPLTKKSMIFKENAQKLDIFHIKLLSKTQYFWVAEPQK